MQNLVEKIAARTGMDTEKATEAVRAIAEHVKTEFPLLHSVVDLVLGTQGFTVKENIVATEYSKDPIPYN